MRQPDTRIGIMLLKEFRELRNVKLTIFLAFLSIPLVGYINWFSEGDVVGGAAVLTFIPIYWGFIMGAQLMHKIMVEEVKKKTFIIVLISPADSRLVIFSKIAIPYALGMIVALLSMLANDYVAITTGVQWMSVIFSFNNVLFAGITLLAGCLLSFLAYLIFEEVNNNTLIPIFLAQTAFLLLLFFIQLNLGILLFGIIAVSSILLILKICDYLFKQVKIEKSKKRKLNFIDVFPERSTSSFLAMVYKEIAELRTTGLKAISYIYTLLLPLLGLSALSMPIQNVNYGFIEFIIMLPVCCWASINILYFSMQKEMLGGTQQLLRIAGISYLKECAAKSLVVYSLSVLHVLCCIVLISVYSVISGEVLLTFIAVKFIIGIVVSIIASGLIALCVASKIKSYKESLFHEILILVLSGAVHILVAFVIYIS